MRNIPKLIETAEAHLYEAKIRDQVVSLMGAQLLLEWRYWVMMIIFITAAVVSANRIESANLHWLTRIMIGFCVYCPGALLWSYSSWRLQRWVLKNRRKTLLSAMRP